MTLGARYNYWTFSCFRTDERQLKTFLDSVEDRGRQPDNKMAAKDSRNWWLAEKLLDLIFLGFFLLGESTQILMTFSFQRR
ncbi:hypothetical protein RRG08_011466 [Elysia crispata]|uniref:Uncharacterized protein n=1 Tax=Elysia crispata TaxID=231223 RepID=A0AAE0YTF7_9GAST|nr:hypothetical protein RRG08_011466 [Elysia crispata]